MECCRVLVLLRSPPLPQAGWDGTAEGVGTMPQLSPSLREDPGLFFSTMRVKYKWKGDGGDWKNSKEG